jgi:hypothetical protein
MGTYSELMKAGKHSVPQVARELHSKEKKGAKNRAPSRNCNIVINITITQSDIDDLREPTSSTQTMRLRESDAEILKDTAYLLRKTTKKTVMQSDVMRLAIRIAHKLAMSKDGALVEVIGQIIDRCIDRFTSHRIRCLASNQAH